MSTDGTKIPEGTVTLLSTDLVGSTRLNQALGDEASATLEREIKKLALEALARFVLPGFEPLTEPRLVFSLGASVQGGEDRTLR